MTMFLLYIIKSSICLTLLYVLYTLLMRRSTLFRFNRMTLLIGSAMCMLLPLVPITVSESGTMQVPMQILNEILLMVDEEAIADGAQTEHVTTGQTNPSHPTTPPTLLLWIYLTGAMVTLGLTIVSCIRMWSIILRAPHKEENGYRLVVVPLSIRSFCFGRYIVLSEEDYSSNPYVLMHEQMHLSNRHTLDLVWFMLLTSLHWFNPFVWLMRNEILQVHEYQADEGVIRQGTDAREYQLLIVQKAVGKGLFSMANGFNQSKLNSRINMMLTKRSDGRMRFRMLLALPVIFVTLLAFAHTETKTVTTELADSPHLSTAESKTDSTYLFPEVMAKFPGGMSALSEHLRIHTDYPDEIQKAGIAGRVVIEFDIETDGSVSNAKVRRSVHPALDISALDAVNSLPRFTPAKNKGENVKTRMTVPINFQLPRHKAK